MSFPELNTVFFDQNFYLTRSPMIESFNQRLIENQYLLALLTCSKQDVHDSPILERIEAKLNLSLYLQLKNLIPNELKLLSCRLGLETLFFIETHDNGFDHDAHFIQIQIDPFWQMPLSFEVKLFEKTPEYKIWRADTKDNLNELSQEYWEKWVFSKHREWIKQHK